MPRVQGYRDWRGRLVVFHDVDIVTMIEPELGPESRRNEAPVAVPHIVRGANRLTVSEIGDEIHRVKATPAASAQQGRLLALGQRAPRFARLLFFWALKRNPHWVKQLEGTAVVTSIGMFGKGGGWGIGFLPVHTLGLTVGGIAPKPGVHDGQIAIREMLNLTISFDHDIVDGAPAARFARILSELIETATVLDELAAGRSLPTGC